MILKVKIEVTKKIKFFFCISILIFWHVVYTKVLYKLILISGHLLHQDPQQRIKYSHFLITLEVNISEAVADRAIVTMSDRNSYMNFHFTW